MQMPHPHLIVLRSVATLELSAIIGQAGWAAAWLGGEGDYFPYHQVGAWVTLVLCAVGAVVYLVLRRSAGPVNTWLAVTLAVLVVIQFLLGEHHATAMHIFLGVLIAMVATALTSWTYRHQLASCRQSPRRFTS